MEVIRAGGEWKDKILAFANRVFGDDVKPGGFAGLIPDIYGETASCEGNHFLVVEGDRIQALLLMEPVTFVCKEEELAGVGVGTVSVDPEARGKGYMQLLLKTVREEMEKKGYAFAVLSGQRQRYGYWGYEPAGIQFRGEIGKGTVRHGLTKEVTGGMEREMTLIPMEEGSAEEKMACSLYCSRPVHTQRRKEGFALHLHSNWSEPFVILRNGYFAGYLTASFRGGNVLLSELELEDESLFPAALRAFFEQKAPEGFAIRQSICARDRVLFLEKLCDGYTLRPDHQYYVADLEKVLAFSMRVKKCCCGLSDGEWSFCTPKGRYECRVDGGKVSVCLEKSRAEKEDLPGAEQEDAAECRTIPEEEMVRLLFGILPVMSGLPGDIPADWLPLPLYLPHVDAV